MSLDSQLEEALAALKTIVGDRGWLAGPDTESYSVDWRGAYGGEALLVVRPATVQEVAAVINQCRAAGITIVSQGGNTGLSGGAAPYSDRPNVVVSTNRMRSIIAIDAECFTMTVEAGVTIEQAQDAARSVGRELAVDWGARGTATVGGAISTDAGGINVLRSGTMRDQVLGLEVVLPDGQIWDGLRALRKDASGYGLKHLFIGAEGTLGLVTKAVLRLGAHRSERTSFFASVADFDRLPELYSLAQEVGQTSLCAFELIPERGLAATVAGFPDVTRPLQAISDWYVLGQMCGNRGVNDLIADFLGQAVDRGLLEDAVVADTAAQEQSLWTMRDELPPEKLFDISGAKFDVAVPVNRVAEYHNAVAALAPQLDPDLITYAFGHLGDGNLHLYLFFGPDSTRTMSSELRDEITANVDELTWSFGGTISAEHGIGQALRDRMTGQKGDVELELLKRVKDVIDPTGLFNPNRGSHGSLDQ